MIFLGHGLSWHEPRVRLGEARQIVYADVTPHRPSRASDNGVCIENKPCSAVRRCVGAVRQLYRRRRKISQRHWSPILTSTRRKPTPTARLAFTERHGESCEFFEVLTKTVTGRRRRLLVGMFNFRTISAPVAVCRGLLIARHPRAWGGALSGWCVSKHPAKRLTSH